MVLTEMGNVMNQNLYNETIEKVNLVLLATGNDNLSKAMEKIILGLFEHIKDEEEPKDKQTGTKGKPTLQEVSDYCLERNNAIDPNQWYDFYTANGWKVGKNPMKDWKASVRTWEKTHPAKQQPEEPLILVELGKFYIDDDESYCKGYADLVKGIPQERRDRICEWFIDKFNGQKVKLSFIRSVLTRARGE